MKTNFLLMISAILLTVGMTSLAHAAPGGTRLVQVGISDVFVPAGFDSNSEVYVVASGVFPNGCYRWSHAEVSHREKNVHEVRSMANVSQGMCIMVLVPFSKPVKLGKFSPGKHTLRFVNGDGTYLEKNLAIE